MRTSQAADVNDPAASATSKSWDRSFATVEGPVEVGLDHLTVVVDRLFGQLAEMADAGIVNQDIEAAE